MKLPITIPKYHLWYLCQISLQVMSTITFTNLIICHFCFFYLSVERITSEEKAIFEDVIEDFSSIDSIKSRFEEWKNKHEDCYTNAYISLCLPKLFAPFIRLQLLDWNPFEVQLIPFL